MQENYQPVVLRKILLSKGATREEIEEELRKYNPESESQSMTNTVMTVLRERNNVIRKENEKFVINSFHELSSDEIQELVDACNERIEEFEEDSSSNESERSPYWIASGSWKNWNYTINNPPIRWGTKAENLWKKLEINDFVFCSASSKSDRIFNENGIFMLGKVKRKFELEKNDEYYPDASSDPENFFKYRFELEPLKIVKTDNELLPLVSGLTPRQSINHITNPEVIHELLDNLETFWNIKLDSSKSNNWIWSVTPENWEIVKAKNIWASKIPLEKINQKIFSGDKVIFYVQGTGEFQGIFEFVGEWYDAPEPVWSDETVSVIYPSQIKLKPIKIGSVKVYDVAPELKMFSNLDDKRLINLVLKGGGGYPSNNGKPIVYQDYQKLLELMTDSEDVIKYWKISPGEAGEDWENQKSRGLIGIHFFDFDLTDLSEDELRNKISEKYGAEEVAKRANTFGQVRNFMSIKEGDIIVANSGKSKILGIGRVVGPYKFRKEEKFPHTFPVDWYDTTEGTIPKQEGWMVTVIPLKKKEFEELTKLRIKYLLLRHSLKGDSQWEDEFGKTYHYGKIPNYSKLTTGSKVIWYDRADGKYLFLGHGDVKKIDQNTIGDDLYAEMENFEKFEPPKIATEELRSKITSLPNFNNQHSILQITKEIFDDIVSGEEKPKTFDDEKLSLLTPAEIKSGYATISDELLIPEEKITEIVTALASGRHVLLAGPIGTGKTRLAKMIPEIFWDKVGGYYSEDHTATADWSTQDVIGGIYPKMEDRRPVYDIQNGCVVDTVRKNWENGVNGGKRIPLKEPQKNPPYKGTWLIIDEFNRADIDKAFGQLFTALRTRWLKIPTDEKGVSYKNLKIPEDYRIIGTLNTADKHFLFQLSDALKSRFAYIEIDIPKREQREKEIYYAMKNALDELGFDGFYKIVLDDKNKRIDKEKSEIDFYNRVMQAYYFLDTVRVFKKLGTAILKLIYQNLVVGTIMTENSKTSLDNALTSNLIPQLENISITFVSAIHAMHSDTLVSFLKEAYKSPNRQSYVEAFEKILDYLQIQNKIRLVSDFANGNIKIENEEVWRPIQTAYDNKKTDFEIGLEQIKQSMDDLINSMVI